MTQLPCDIEPPDNPIPPSRLWGCWSSIQRGYNQLAMQHDYETIRQWAQINPNPDNRAIARAMLRQIELRMLGKLKQWRHA